ncbi:unnamed protein product, partial [Gulo gulo]
HTRQPARPVARGLHYPQCASEPAHGVRCLRLTRTRLPCSLCGFVLSCLWTACLLRLLLPRSSSRPGLPCCGALQTSFPVSGLRYGGSTNWSPEALESKTCPRQWQPHLVSSLHRPWTKMRS